MRRLVDDLSVWLPAGWRRARGRSGWSRCTLRIRYRSPYRVRSAWWADVYAVRRAPMYLTIDVGHMNASVDS